MPMWSVMLVDDELAVVQGLQKNVDWLSLGAQVVCTACSGREALALFEEHRPDIVITDINMPGMNGLELMEAIQARVPHTTFVILSGYDTFEYAQRSLQVGAIDYVLKPATLPKIMAVVSRAVQRCTEDHLRRRLEQELPCLREYFLLRLLRDDPTAEEAEFLGLTALLDGPFSVALVCLDRSFGVTEQEWQLSRLFARDAASGEGVYALPNWGTDMPVLLHRPADPEGWCKALLEKLQAGCRAEVTVALSCPTASVREAYSQARDAMAYKEILGAGRVIRCDRLALESDLLPPYPMDRNRSLLEAMRLGDAALVSRQVRQMYAGLKRAPLSYVRAVSIEVYGLAATALSERGQLMEDVCRPEQFWTRVGTAQSVDEICAWVEDRLSEVAGRLNVRRETRHHQVLRELEGIIAARYAEDLTLEGLAKSVFLSRTYVIWLFKQVKGCSFLDYLTRFRMEKARELLLSTGRSVYEVAEQVGYKNSAYFSRVFREHFGHMPSELRKGLG